MDHQGMDQEGIGQQGIIDMVENDFPFLSRMGLRAVILEPNRVKLRLPMASNGNHMGSIWAGALFTLAEIPGGILVYTTFGDKEYIPLVREMNIRFLKPALGDVTIDMSLDSRVSARLLKTAEEEGKADFILEGEILDGDNEVIAVSRGDYRMMKIKKGR